MKGDLAIASLTAALAVVIALASLCGFSVSATELPLLEEASEEALQESPAQANASEAAEPQPFALISEESAPEKIQEPEPLLKERLVLITDEDDKATSADVTITSKASGEVVSAIAEPEPDYYTIEIRPASHPIKEIIINDAVLSAGSEAAMRIDDVPEDIITEYQFVEVYAIDPTALNFTEATVTATAKGTELWKCKDWNFEARRCDGEWAYLMSITPGQDYTFTLTSEDPGYAELSPQYIIECTEGGAPGTCTFAYLATDDTQYEQFRVDKGAVINRLNVSVNSTSVPTNAMITNATVCILAYRDSTLGDDAGDACGIYAGENATGTPTYTTAVSKTQATCQLWTTSVGNPNRVCGEITTWLNGKADPIASARKLIIVFDGTEQSDNNVDLWIDYMYANITYALKPNVTLVSPSNGNVTSTKDVNFTCNATDDLQLKNITFYWNYTGTWQSNGTVSVSGTSNQTTFQRTNLSNGAILWNCYACDNESACAFAPSNWTVTVNYTAPDNPPTVTLSYPPDNYYNDTSQYVNLAFNASVTDDYALVNCSLWHNYTGTWQLNQTREVSGANNITNFTLDSLTNTTFIWNIQCYDNAGQSAFAAANRTVILNWTAPPNQPPQVALNQPANNTQFNNTQDINFNFTATDDLSAALSCSIYLDDNLNQTNNSVQNNTLTNFLITGISYGSHNWSINCTDGELSNVSGTRYFTLIGTLGPTIIFIPPTPDNNSVVSRDWVTINASVTNGGGVDTCILEWNGSNESMAKVGAGANVTCHATKTSLAGNTNYTYKVYANDTSSNWNVSETRSVFIGTPPEVIVLHPSPGEVFDENDVVVLVANITDPDGLNLTVAEVTLPNSSKQNVTLYIPPNADNFDTNTVGIAWTVENESVGENQTCIADIDTTVPDMAYTSISGNGSPLTDTYCGLVSMYPVCKYFDMNISFNITHEEGVDYAMMFSLMESTSLLESSKIIFMSIGNWTGYGRTYDVFISDGNISDYISERPTNDTHGKFRIKREGSNFTFYTWNNTANDWHEEARQENVNMPCALFINLESETAETGWGSINVTWDDLIIAAPELHHGVFSDASVSGIYNVTFIARDNLGAVNDTEQTYFNITEVNDAPTVPYILSPAPGNVIGGTIQIQWSDVYDEEGDSLQYNITLLNPDYSENATIVTNYGNASTTSYDWDTTLFQDGNYSLKVVVFENETAEGLSSYSIMTGAFSIDNTQPAIEFVPPTETSGTTINRNYIQINVTANDAHLDYIEVFLYNSTGDLINQTMGVSSPYFVNFTDMDDGLYYFNATAYDMAGNYNYTETRNVTILAKTASICSLEFTPPSPQTYGTAVNASCSCTNPEASATLYRNGTDVTSTENNIYTLLPAGSWYYVCNVTETQNYTSASNSSTYVVNKATPVLTLNITPSTTVTYGTQTNASCVASTPQVVPQLYRNGTPVSNPDVQVLAAGTYNYTCNASETQNYTAPAEVSQLLNVNKASTYTELRLNGERNNLTVTYPTAINATANTSFGSVTIYRNGTPIASGNPATNVSVLPAGYYNYTAVNPGNENYSSSYETWFATVNKNTSSCWLSVSSSPVVYGTQTQANCTCSNPESSAKLYRNGTDVTAENGTFVTLPAGDWHYVCNVTETQNYTAASDYDWINVTQATTILTLTASPSWSVINGTPTTVNCSANNAEVNISLYRNATYIGSSVGGTVSDVQTLDIGTYNYTCNTTGSQNYTSASESNILTVLAKTQSYCYLSFDPPSGQTWPVSVNATCSCTNPEAAATLYRNGTDVTSENSTPVALAAGSYGYVCNVSETANYSAASNSSTYVINKQPTAVYLFLNGAQANLTMTYGAQSNATAIGYNGTVTLYRNGTPVSNPEIATLAAGDYNYTASIPDDQNRTGSSKTFFLAVSKANSSVNLTLNGIGGNITVYINQTVNMTGRVVVPSSGYIELYDNGTLISSGPSPLTNITSYPAAGLHNITLVYSATQNYTASSMTHFINVIPDTTPPVISSVSAASITNSSASIIWTTDEPANSTVNYGNTTALGTLVANATLATSHAILLSNLSANTTYYYNVTSCDASGNCNTTGPHSFVTLPALLPNGSPCSKASECEGGYCVHGVCRSAATYCGDGYCDSGETSSSCPSDCPRVGTKSVPGGIQVHEVSEEGYLLRQFVYASAGAQIRIDLSAARSPLMMLEVMAAAYVPMGYIEFVELDIAPILEQLEFYTSRTTVVPIAPRLYTPAMAQIVYSAFSVEFVDGRSSIGEITFRFKVAKSWLDEKSADYKTIRLLRNEGESWTALDTHLDGEDEEYYYYSAVSSDLSMYAIVATSPQALCAACASGDWSPCVSGTQTRAVAECGAHTGYACHYAIESRACELPSPTPAALAPVPELPPGSIDFAISILALAAAFCYFRLTELCRKPGKSKR